jgi:hypothetical protein
MFENKLDKKRTFQYSSIYICAFLLSFIIALKSTDVKAQIFIGAKSGVRTSWLNYDEFAREDFKRKPFIGYSAGITASFKAQKRFLLQVDVMYTQNGKRLEGVSETEFRNNARYHYINTPIVYKLDFKEVIGKKSFKWYLGVGPNVNFWLGGNGKLRSVELLEENIEELNYDIIFEELPANPEFGGLYVPEANRVQVGLILSTGMVLEPAAGRSLIIDFRYEWGHSFLAREEARFTNVIAYNDNLRATNQAFQLSVAYVFDITNKGKKERKMYYENK